MNTDDEAKGLGDQMKKIAASLDKQAEESLRVSRSASERAPRTPRSAETRDADLAQQTWRPADSLPDPPQRDGWVHRWVRGSSRGEIDSVNMARSMREGWRPCAAEDYPEIVATMYNRGESTNTIEFGGLILCRLPVERAKARAKYYEEISLRQINSVNARLREDQEQDGRVKYTNEGTSIVNNRPPR
jgi:hypothetical protein